MTDGERRRRRVDYAMGDGVNGLSGGFWRRVIAFWIDHAVVGLALTVIAAALFTPTNGLIRHSNPVLDLQSCVAVDEANSSSPEPLLVLPAAGPLQMFRPDRPPDAARVMRCDTPYVDASAVASFRWSGGFGYRETVAYPLTPADRVTLRTVDLSALFFGVLLLWLAFAEAVWGAGPGKRLMGLRVVGDDGVSPARIGATMTRNALLYAPQGAFGLLVALYGLIPPAPGGLMFDPVAGWLVVALGGAAALWNLILVLAVLFQRPDPFWDRWAGVRVRRRVRIVAD
jgi:hypothetical protein